jgi:hypothetical protein
MIRPLCLAVTVAAALASSAGTARAQFAPWGGGFGYNPYWGAYGAGNVYGSYLQGGASVVQAQGQYLQDYQQAKVTREQARQAKVDTRRKVFDNWLYERAMTPTPEQLREEAMMEQLRRARNNPPAGDIFSGKALNDLFDNIKKFPTAGPTIAISEETMRRINFTGEAANSGNFGLFRNGGKLNWPISLNTSAFRSERENFESMVSDALRQARTGNVDGDAQQKMHGAVDDMKAKLKKEINNLSPGQYMDAKRYLNDLDAAVTSLGDPNVAKLADSKMNSRGNVQELVQYMVDNGLSFAPAVRGDEGAYRALHQALVEYDTAVASNGPQPTLRAPNRFPGNIPPPGGGFAFPGQQ